MRKKQRRRQQNNRSNNKMYKLFFNTILLAMTIGGHGQTTSPAIIRSEFLYDTASFPECHAATIAETPGGLVTAFFGGTQERNPDVCIYVCRKNQGSAKWSAPMNVANGIQND